MEHEIGKTVNLDESKLRENNVTLKIEQIDRKILGL